MASAPDMEVHCDSTDKLGHVDLMPLQLRVKVLFQVSSLFQLVSGLQHR